MRFLFSLLLILVCLISFGQQRTDFSAIDWRVQSIEAPTPDSLAKKLTAPYTTDLQKVRAIFCWITEHIAYRTRSYRSPLSTSRNYVSDDPGDTAVNFLSLNERVARMVLSRRIAVCDGYARLFKVLCDNAGLKSEIITGYARGDRSGATFRANHTWNAVYIDSTWHLLDVTWASGFITYSSNEFVKAFDAGYFLTPPDEFIRDHYPEDIRWALLDKPPVLQEFNHTPFKHKAFIKYKILSYYPSSGVIQASVGDTLSFHLQLDEKEKSLVITDRPFADTAQLTEPEQTTAKQSSSAQKTVASTYIVTSPDVEWLYAVLDHEIIMQYKLNVKKSDMAGL